MTILPSVAWRILVPPSTGTRSRPFAGLRHDRRSFLFFKTLLTKMPSSFKLWTLNLSLFFLGKKKIVKRKLVTFVQRIESEDVNESSYHVFFSLLFLSWSKRLIYPSIGSSHAHLDTLSSSSVASSEPPLPPTPATAGLPFAQKVKLCNRLL